MTIGIAAWGPDAGEAVVRALAAVETVGRGAIGGFVSFVAITEDGVVERAETQRGGAAALFGRSPSVPAKLGRARLAALMSSGPDRPEPLSQFTPAEAGIGLVTGHRMPNTPGARGVSLNRDVLERMRSGLAPAQAVDEVLAWNPDADAGIIALAMDGRCHAADTPLVRLRGDTGQALVGSAAQGAVAAVLHNAIHPHRPLACLAAEVALDRMLPGDRPDGWITFREGARLAPGPANAVDVDTRGEVECIVVKDPKFLAGLWSFGIGFEIDVRRNRKPVASILYEPYMVVMDGRLQTIDGKGELSVPIRRL